MLRFTAPLLAAFGLAVLLTFMVQLGTATPMFTRASDRNGLTGEYEAAISSAGEILNYKWNADEKELPLLNLEGDGLKPGFDRSLTYQLAQFRFVIFQALSYDEQRNVYVLPLSTAEGAVNHFLEFQSTEVKNSYAPTDGTNIRLIDNDSMKTIRTADGSRYIFVRYPNGELHCAIIRNPSGAVLNLLYTANGLRLHGVVDNSGRTVTFNYDSAGIGSVTQTWMANATGLTRTWIVGEPPETVAPEIRYSHAITMKTLPANAVVRQYTAEMAASDRMLAHIFGGPNAIGAANGFEPAELASSYPAYRGDTIGDDGIERRGHLSYAMHLYGSPDGTGDSALYVPAGFTSHSQPSPTDAAVTFYYPHIGNLVDVTLAVFHVAEFQIIYERERVRIGKLGGPGGCLPLYKHSHIEFYRGNSGLPPTETRAQLRIDPTKVFPLPAHAQ